MEREATPGELRIAGIEAGGAAPPPVGLLESEQYRSILDSLPQRVFVKDRDLAFLFWNRAFAEGIGVSPGEIVGKTDFDFFPAELAEKYRADDKKVMAAASPVDTTERYVEKGRQLFVHTVKAPLRDANGTVIGLLGIFWDVTEQVELERARARAEVEISRLAAIAESSQDAIVGIDPEGIITSWNSGARRIYGYTAEEAIGRSVSMILPVDREEEGRQLLRKLVGGGSVAAFETVRCREDGTPVDVSIASFPVKDRSGVVIGAASIARDITEEKRAEAERKRLQEQIRRQAQEILDMSTPVIQVWNGIVAVPLIGTLDSQRTQQVTEQLLQRIVDTRSSVALLDITGVPAIDTQTARHLIETITAVRLLGAQVVLTGIRPAIAQTLVHLGIDLSSVVTRSSLSAGLAVALEMLDLRITDRNGDRR